VTTLIITAAVDGGGRGANAVMEQNVTQDEQANKFSAEVRIRKTQV